MIPRFAPDWLSALATFAVVVACLLAVVRSHVPMSRRVGRAWNVALGRRGKAAAAAESRFSVQRRGLRVRGRLTPLWFSDPSAPSHGVELQITLPGNSYRLAAAALGALSGEPHPQALRPSVVRNDLRVYAVGTFEAAGELQALLSRVVDPVAEACQSPATPGPEPRGAD